MGQRCSNNSASRRRLSRRSARRQLVRSKAWRRCVSVVTLLHVDLESNQVPARSVERDLLLRRGALLETQRGKLHWGLILGASELSGGMILAAQELSGGCLLISARHSRALVRMGVTCNGHRALSWGPPRLLQS